MPGFHEFKNMGIKTNFSVQKYSKEVHTDRLLEERVKQYINQNKHRAFINADALVDHLRRQFPEYSRRKRPVVKYQAGRVVAKLCYEDNMDSDSKRVVQKTINSKECSQCSILSSDDETSNVGESLTNMNNTLTKLYKSETSNPEISNLETSRSEVVMLSRDDKTDRGSTSSISTITLDDEQTNTSEGIEVVASRKRKLNNQSSLVVSADTSYTSDVPNVESIPMINKLKVLRKKPRMQNKKSDVNTQNSILQTTESNTPTFCVPNVTFSDVVGYHKILSEVVRLMMHIFHPEIYNHIGIDPPRGFLLHGPPGCGKTLLAHAVAGELEIPLIDIAAPELVAGVTGISEQRIRKLFENAVKVAPCILFIDEIDCITQNRETANRDMEKRIVSQLLSCMDKLNHDPKGTQVLVIGATNRPDSLDPALRRAGRFDREVCMGIPDKESRYDILRFMCSKLKLSEDVCLREIAAHTPGYVGADLLSLIRESALSAVHRAMENISKCKNIQSDSVSPSFAVDINCDILGCEKKSNSNSITEVEETLKWMKNKFPIDASFLNNVCVTREDITLSLKRVQPSSKREGFVTIPDVTWDDIGSLKDVREAIQLAILAPVKYPNHFNELGLPLSMGVLLCGPPGCGKTLLAKAVANEAGVNFISVKGPELLNMYVGGSEKAVRECFQRAKNSQPCVIFFDELDALCPKRSDHAENGTGMRVVNQLLTEMDGVEGRAGVFLIAATNRPDIIDPAVLRPGRLDKILHVGFPNEEDRNDILKALTKNGSKPPLKEDVKLSDIAKNPLCEGFTGADLAALVRDASLLALSDIIIGSKFNVDSVPVFVSASHFDRALEKLRPSVSEKDRKHYDQLRLRFTTSAYQMQKK